MAKTMYNVRLMPIMQNEHTLENTTELCYTKSKLWANLVFFYHIWKIPADHRIMYISLPGKKDG